MKAKGTKTGIVIYQEPEVWLKIEQRVLDQKKLGIKTNKSNEGARLMQIGLKAEKTNH